MVKSVYSSHKKVVQKWLRQVRMDAGLSQLDLSRKLNQHQSFVSKYECGERRLDILELRIICHAVGVSLTELIRKIEKDL